MLSIWLQRAVSKFCLLPMCARFTAETMAQIAESMEEKRRQQAENSRQMQDQGAFLPAVLCFLSYFIARSTRHQS